MKTLIVYATKYGTTQKCAQTLAEALPGGAELFPLGQTAPQLDAYDAIIIGSPIYIGMVQKPVKEFCSCHKDSLLQKKLGVFLCNSTRPEDIARVFSENFDSDLLQHAAATGNFGGEMHREKMKLADKLIASMVAKADPTRATPSINTAAIAAFAAQFGA